MFGNITMKSTWDDNLEEMLQDGPFHIQQDSFKFWWVMNIQSDGIARCKLEREAAAIARALNKQLLPNAQDKRP